MSCIFRRYYGHWKNFQRTSGQVLECRAEIKAQEVSPGAT